MTLSIIIPVYNAEKYIEACVRSLSPVGNSLGINPEDIEVILVDDGSKDNSGAICDRLTTEQFPFSCKAIHQPNQGVSVARNTGISHASGEWLWFIDADDYIEYTPSSADTPTDFSSHNFILTGFIWEENENSDKFDAKPNEIPYNLWRCMFKKNVIEDIHLTFTVGRKYAEDQEFIINYLLSLKHKNSKVLNNIYYHYTLREGSAMTRKNVKIKKITDLFIVNCMFAIHAILKGMIFKSWVLHELKRMTKALIVITFR